VDPIVTTLAQAGPSVLLAIAVWVLWSRLKEVEAREDKLRDEYTGKLESFLTQVVVALHDLED